MSSIENDVHYGMSWVRFKELITGYGFREVIIQELLHPDNDGELLESVVYCYEEKGLILVADSMRDREFLHSYTMAGQIKVSTADLSELLLATRKHYKLSLLINYLSGSKYTIVDQENGVATFSFGDAFGRGLLEFLTDLDTNFEYFSSWTHPVDVDFSSYIEKIWYVAPNPEKYTLLRLLKMPKFVRNIVQPTIDDLYEKVSVAELHREGQVVVIPPVKRGIMDIFRGNK